LQKIFLLFLSFSFFLFFKAPAPTDPALVRKNPMATAVSWGLVFGIVGAAVVAGIAAVAIGFFLTSAGSVGAGALSAPLMTAANTSPLYEADLFQQVNPLAE